jgi:hypothetical protein
MMDLKSGQYKQKRYDEDFQKYIRAWRSISSIGWIHASIRLAGTSRRNVAPADGRAIQAQ